MQIAKAALRQAVGAHDAVAANRNLQILINLRAEQVAITLREIQDTYGTIGDAILPIYGKRYVTECLALTRAVHQALRMAP